MIPFELRRALKAGSACTGFALVMLLPLLGLLLQRLGLLPANSRGVLPLAFASAFVIAVRANAAADRELGFDHFAAINLGAQRYVAAKLAAIVCLHTTVVLCSLIAGLIMLYDRIEYALWYAALFFLLGLLLLPLVLVIEVVGRTRIPAAVALLVFTVTVLVSAGVGDDAGILQPLGLVQPAGDFAGLKRLLVIDLLLVPPAVALIGTLWRRALAPRLEPG